jgi:hypothetical protein
MALHAQSDQWVLVYSGPHGLADLYAEELRANDIPVFTPDRNIKMLDPAIAGGGNVFDIDVLVPREFERDARELLGGRPDDTPADPDFAPPAPERRAADLALRELRNQIGWCGFVPFLAPYGLWLAARYFKAARHVREPASGHAATVLATTLCVAQSTFLAYMAFEAIRAFAR